MIWTGTGVELTAISSRVTVVIVRSNSSRYTSGIVSSPMKLMGRRGLFIVYIQMLVFLVYSMSVSVSQLYATVTLHSCSISVHTSD